MRLDLKGELDAGSVPALWRAHRTLGALERIDLAGVTRIDSAGVALVRRLQARSLEAGTATRIDNPPGHYQQLLDAHRLRPSEPAHD